MTNPYQAEIDRLRRDLTETRAELDEWRAGGGSPDRERSDELARISHVRRSLNLRLPSAARLALALYDVPRPLSRETLDELVPSVGVNERNTTALFSALVCYLRKGLGADGVETIRGWGYALTPTGRAKMDAIVAGMS
tara:strand:- start:628 stop:1041 length:414 start_codon:yes stop_codon:yes gene_type:complete